MRRQSILKNRSPRYQVFVEVRTQILLCYIGLMTILMGISIPTIHQAVYQQIDRRLQTEVVSEIEEFQHELAMKNPQNFSQLQQMIVEYLSDELIEEDQFFIVLLNQQVFQSSPLVEDLPKSFQPHSPLINQLKSTEQFSLEDFMINDAEIGKIIYMTLPIPLKGQNQGVFIVAYAVIDEYKEAASAMGFVLWITSILFLLTSTGAWFISGWVLKPLRVMSATARQISEKDLSQRLPVSGRGEMAEVADTFNEMMDRLQKAFFSQRNFINDASHELRTPITIVQGHLELMGDDREEQQQTLALVHEELERMNRLVGDLLTLAKAEQPDFIRPELIEVEVLTHELYTKTKVLSESKLQLEAVGTGHLYIDRQRLTQAIINLIDNAVQCTPSEGTVFFGSACSDRDVRFWVKDTGIGIALSDQQRIFDRFARAANSRRRSNGYGLGLSITQAIVTACGGWIELDSTLGKGSTFTLVFPINSASISPQNFG